MEMFKCERGKKLKVVRKKGTEIKCVHQFKSAALIHNDWLKFNGNIKDTNFGFCVYFLRMVTMTFFCSRPQKKSRTNKRSDCST